MTPEQTFAQMVAQGDIALDKLRECAERTPDKTFIHYGEDGVRLTFAQFVDDTDRFAGGLLEAGVAPGDSVSVLTRNSPVSAIAMFGIWRAGCSRRSTSTSRDRSFPTSSPTPGRRRSSPIRPSWRS